MNVHIVFVLVLAVLGLLMLALIPIGAWFGSPDVVKGSAILLAAIVVIIFAVAAMAPA